MVLCLLAACTPVSEPAQVRLQLTIDADDAVRAESLEVEARLEKQDPNGGSWILTGTARSFRPPSSADWPLWAEQAVRPRDFNGRYQLTATARDAQMAVVAQARVIADLGSAHAAPTLAVYLEASCLRRSELCGPNLTCHAGDCVSASLAPGGTQLRDPSGSAADGGTDTSSAGSGDAGAPPPKVAQESGDCSSEDATSCSDGADPVPLVCRAGSWQRQAPCRQQERCALDSGECRTVAPECVGRGADEVFCDGDQMRICSDRLSSKVRPCGDHEHCIADARGARCGCEVGYVKDTAGCKEATECGLDYGGCDPLTTCRVEHAQVECGDCPAGYTGQGKTGCLPLLSALSVAGGELVPSFSPDSYDYRVKVPLLWPTTTIEAAGPDGTRVEVNTHPMNGARFETPVLALGDNAFEVSPVARSGKSSTYHVVIERQGAERAYIKASNAEANDLLGTMAAISGDTIIAGAPSEDGGSKQVNGDESSNSATESGAVYVWVRSGSSWVKQAYLKAMDAMAGDIFGATVGIWGDTIVVGAVRTDPIGTSYQHPGAAYVFVRKDGTWSQQARLTAHDGAPGDSFGHFVAIEGDTIAVGATRAGGSGDSPGAVYVFTRSGAEWSEQTVVRANQPMNGSNFGSTVLLDRGTMLVAAELEQRGAGAAYVFVRKPDGSYTQQARLTAEQPRDNEIFGSTMALRENTIAIGAPNSMQPLVVPSGSVYVFERSGDDWRSVGVLHPIVPRSDDYFGSSVGLTSRAIVVGASGENSGGRGIGADPRRADGTLSGAVYVFPREPAGWTSPTFIKASNADARDGFGYTFANSENVLVVGAPFEASAAKGVNGKSADNSAIASGALYLFE